MNIATNDVSKIAKNVFGRHALHVRVHPSTLLKFIAPST